MSGARRFIGPAGALLAVGLLAVMVVSGQLRESRGVV